MATPEQQFQHKVEYLEALVTDECERSALEAYKSSHELPDGPRRAKVIEAWQTYSARFLCGTIDEGVSILIEVEVSPSALNNREQLIFGHLCDVISHAGSLTERWFGIACHCSDLKNDPPVWLTGDAGRTYNDLFWAVIQTKLESHAQVALEKRLARDAHLFANSYSFDVLEPDYSLVRFEGEELVLTEQRAAVVKKLHTEREKHSTVALNRAAKREPPDAKLSNLLDGTPLWKTVIVPDGKGFYRWNQVKPQE